MRQADGQRRERAGFELRKLHCAQSHTRCAALTRRLANHGRRDRNDEERAALASACARGGRGGGRVAGRSKARRRVAQRGGPIMPVFFILGKPNTKPHTPRSACFPRMANAPVTLFATQCETAPRNCTRNRGAARRSDSGPGVVSSLERQSSDTAARARLLAFSSGAAAPL